MKYIDEMLVEFPLLFVPIDFRGCPFTTWRYGDNLDGGVYIPRGKWGREARALGYDVDFSSAIRLFGYRGTPRLNGQIKQEVLR